MLRCCRHLALASALLAGCAGDPSPLLWEVAGAQGSLQLLGTIHLGIAARGDLPEVVWERFDAAGTLVAEAEIRNVDRQAYRKLASLPAGTTLDTLVGSRRVTSLSGGGYLNTVSTSMTIPAGFDSGSYYLCQIIDSAGEVTEFAENNNTTYVPVTIINSLIFADGFESGNTSAW